MIGQTISHYKILEKLGEGGMGVVYKAEDTKLKREVALKFLPTNALQGEAEKDRFLREAQAAASLNHSNIATVYEVDEADDKAFIAMELIHGHSLHDIIEKGPLKIGEAINYANQIAAGLQVAHKKGITHRDIKSANIMITEEEPAPGSRGQVKIMDFGLAKLADRSMMTKEGTTLGTAAYMSPEQSRGEKVDERTDIWSLGVVLYEMISGQLPFKGDYEQAVMYSILNEDPEPLTALRTGVPMALDGVIAKALAKDPDTRYQHVDEMPVDLKAIKASPSGISRVSTTTGVAAGAPPTARWRHALPWSLVVLMTVVAGIMTLWGLMRPTPSTRGPLARFVVTLPSRQQLVGVIGSEVALSPDGMHFAYVGVGVEGTQLFLRAMDQLDARPILGTEGARSPFFSPDGQWVGFFTERRLKKVALAEGPPLTIAEASGTARGASWGSNDVIVFNPIEGSGLTRVSAAGGVPELVTTPNVKDGEVDHRFPEILPGGNAVVFTIWTGSIEDAHIGVLSLKTGEVKRLRLEGTSPRYASTGHLLYGRADGLLLAVPFDLVRLEVIGPVAAILEDIMVEAGGDANFTISRNGSLLYFHSTLALRIVMVDRQGAAYPVSEELGSIATPRFSPDGGRIAITGISEGGTEDIWVYDMEQGTLSPLTFEGANTYPIWTPDCTRVTFSSDRAGTWDLFWKPADNSGPAESLLTAEHEQIADSWTPDGQLLIFEETHPTTGRDIWVLPLEGKRTPWTYLQTPFDEWSPLVSPDGRWLVYVSDRSGRAEVYVGAFPDPRGQWQVSSGGGKEPLWAPNGRELFYRSGSKIVAVAVEMEPVFTVGTREVLFEEPYMVHPLQTNYDIHPDGERFVMIKREEASPQLIVVLNWFEELKRRVPGGK